jgi:hypothetical protein
MATVLFIVGLVFAGIGAAWFLLGGLQIMGGSDSCEREGKLTVSSVVLSPIGVPAGIALIALGAQLIGWAEMM